MLTPLSRIAALTLLTTAISASAQLSVPPATFRPATPTKAQVEPALLLPTDAAARSILLSTPTSSERAALAPKVATRTSKDGIVPKRGRLIIGFAREVPATQGSVNLSDLAWAQVEGGTQAAHISLTSSGAAAIRIGLVVTSAPAALQMRFKGSSSTAQVFGPYPAELAHGSIYWSPVLEGETGIIELTLPAGVSPAGMVSLPMISHLVVAGNALRQADPLGEIGRAGACEARPNRAAAAAACSPTTRTRTTMSFVVPCMAATQRVTPDSRALPTSIRAWMSPCPC